MTAPKNEYLHTTYQNKPYTSYPGKLTKYICDKYKIRENSTLLDLGCGRGEFLKGFIDQGMIGYGIDQADTAKKICPEALIVVSDLENTLPFDDNLFDVIYSKSVVEHFYFPEKILQEAYRVLKPNGLIITMTPDWEHNIACFHDDYTHRTPFTKVSLNDIHTVTGFKEVRTDKFIQLPIVWRYPIFKTITTLTRILTPNALKKYSKLVRFSKEVMLITSAKK